MWDVECAGPCIMFQFGCKNIYYYHTAQYILLMLQCRICFSYRVMEFAFFPHRQFGRSAKNVFKSSTCIMLGFITFFKDQNKNTNFI